MMPMTLYRLRPRRVTFGHSIPMEAPSILSIRILDQSAACSIAVTPTTMPLAFNIQFRLEVFNILNHANFAPPSTPTNTDIFDSTGALLTSTAGQLTSTTTTAREIQLAIKVTF